MENKKKIPGEPGYPGPFKYVTPGEMNNELEKKGSDIRVKVEDNVPYSPVSSNISHESTETMGNRY